MRPSLALRRLRHRVLYRARDGRRASPLPPPFPSLPLFLIHTPGALRPHLRPIAVGCFKRRALLYPRAAHTPRYRVQPTSGDLRPHLRPIAVGCFQRRAPLYPRAAHTPRYRVQPTSGDPRPHLRPIAVGCFKRRDLLDPRAFCTACYRVLPQQTFQPHPPCTALGRLPCTADGPRRYSAHASLFATE